MLYDIIIIGSGPAGMTAGIYSARAGKKVLIFEENVVGGQIVNSPLVENYPSIQKISGEELGFNMFEQCQNLNIDFEFDKVCKIENGLEKIVYTPNKQFKAKALIIATGARPRKLNLSNEEELLGKGIGYCVLCDGENYRNQVVGVVGGGNTAVQNALYLSNICKQVYIFQNLEKLTAENTLLEKLKTKNNIKVICQVNVTKLIGENQLKKVELSSNSIIELDGLFVSIGQVPNNSLIKGFINTDDFGFCITDENCETNLSGIFAVGDIRSKKIRQLTTAVADGTIASINASKYTE